MVVNIESVITPKNMETQLRVNEMRNYLDYVSKHLDYIRQSLPLVEIVAEKHPQLKLLIPALREEVSRHDISKLEGDEYQAYRRKHYHTPAELVEYDIEADYAKAKETHTLSNPHHWQTANTSLDILHLMVDWTAKSLEEMDGDNYSTPMSYYFSGTEDVSIKPELLEDFIYLLSEMDIILAEIWERSHSVTNRNTYDNQEDFSELF